MNAPANGRTTRRPEGSSELASTSQEPAGSPAPGAAGSGSGLIQNARTRVPRAQPTTYRENRWSITARNRSFS
jgi:hypothetical protein